MKFAINSNASLYTQSDVHTSVLLPQMTFKMNKINPALKKQKCFKKSLKAKTAVRNYLQHSYMKCCSILTLDKGKYLKPNLYVNQDLGEVLNDTLTIKGIAGAQTVQQN